VDGPADDGDLATSPECRELFGEAWAGVGRFAGLLRGEGVRRGLIGPKEGARLWSRHLVNSAAVVPLLPDAGLVIDVGSGAGLPGIVVALMRPDLEVELLEPMARRVTWLEEVVGHLNLSGVTVTRGRAEEVAGQRSAAAVVARAVAPLGKLAGWAAGLLQPGGALLALKGRQAHTELEAAKLQECGFAGGTVIEAAPLASVEPTYVVVAKARGVSRETSLGRRR
jgi:16S rRNA (guanine527-N7)-methyltransferase